jgi:drug/metabolite transporter (DMT)-like permease
MRSPHLNRPALLALFGGAAAIGFAPILVRLSEVGPTATAFYRLFFALPVLWCWLGWEQSKPARSLPRPAGRRDFIALTVAGFFFVGDLGIWHWSLQHTTVANSTLLANFAPLFVTLAAWFFLGETIRGIFVLGMGVALAGAAMLVGSSLDLSPDHLLGDGLAMLAAVFYAAYLLAIKRLRGRFASLTIMAWAGLVSCLGFLLVALLLGETLWPATARGWLVVVALALITHVGGQTLIAHAFGHLPASYSSLGLLLQPVMAALLAWYLFQERLGWIQGLGGMLVLAGIGLASPRPRVRKK